MFAASTFLDVFDDIMTKSAIIMESAVVVEKEFDAESVQIDGIFLRDHTVFIDFRKNR